MSRQTTPAPRGITFPISASLKAIAAIALGVSGGNCIDSVHHTATRPAATRASDEPVMRFHYSFKDGQPYARISYRGEKEFKVLLVDNSGDEHIVDGNLMTSYSVEESNSNALKTQVFFGSIRPWPKSNPEDPSGYYRAAISEGGTQHGKRLYDDKWVFIDYERQCIREVSDPAEIERIMSRYPYRGFPDRDLKKEWDCSGKE